MLRRWHNLLAPFSAAFLMLLALTGLAIQVTDLLDRKEVAGSDQHSTPRSSSGRAASESGAEGKRGRTPIGQWNHWFKQVHSGEIVGIPGTVLNIMTAVALAYLSGSGLWMYLQPWLRRRRRKLQGTR